MIEKRKLLSAALKLLKAVHDAARKQTPWGFGRSKANFARDVRDIVRSFWRDEIEYYDFIDGMYDIVVAGYDNAWAEGAATCGILPEEFTTDELDALDEMIYATWDPSISFADQIEANRRSLGGKLGPLYRRAELWINKYGEVKALAQRIACRDQKLAWVYDPRKEHCFTAGTPVLTRSGWVPIEKIQKGTEVWTLVGWRNVTRTYDNLYLGPLYKVGEMTCTAGHPFLTSDGWIDAKRLGHCSKRHVALPNADDRKASGFKVGILGIISSLLSFLPFCERLKSRMSMPIIAVRLDDEIPASSIDDELRLDEEIGFVTYTKSVEVRKQRNFQLGGFILLNASVALHKFGMTFLKFSRMLLPIMSDFGTYLRSIHRIVLSHVFAGSIMNKPSSNIGLQYQFENAGPSKNLSVGKPNHFGHFGSTMIGIAGSENIISFFCPDRRTHMLDAIGTVTSAQITADKTFLKSLQFFLRSGRFQSGIMKISTNAVAEPRTCLRRIDELCKRLTTSFTNKILGWVGAFLSACHGLYHRLYRNFTVYNLEVDEAEHYVASGLVVHNCDDCLNLHGRVYRASVWDRYGIAPQSPQLACGGWRCGCRFVVTDDPVTPGRPPNIGG